DVEREADTEVGAQLGLTAGAGMRFPERANGLVAGPAGRRAPADDALDLVLDHEVHRALAGADDGLPAFDGQRLRPRHQRDLAELIAPVRHLGRDRVVLALMREGALVERLEDDLDLLLEQLPVGVLVDDRRAERLDLTAVVTAPDAEDDPAAGQP